MRPDSPFVTHARNVISRDMHLTNILYSNSTFKNVSFRNAYLDHVSFENCVLKNVTFQNITGQRSGFADSLIIDALFNNTNFFYPDRFPGTDLV